MQHAKDRRAAHARHLRWATTSRGSSPASSSADGRMTRVPVKSVRKRTAEAMVS